MLSVQWQVCFTESNTGDLFKFIDWLLYGCARRRSAASNGHWTEPRKKSEGKPESGGWLVGDTTSGKEKEERKEEGEEWGGMHDNFGRRYRSKGEVWSAVVEKHARSTLCAPSLLVLARRQMLCGSAAGGARAGEAAETAASLTHTLTRSRWISTNLRSPPLTPLQSVPVSFSRWISSSSALPNMDAPPPPPPPPPPSSSSAESEGCFFLAQWAGHAVFFAQWMWGNRCPACRWWSCHDLAAALLHVKGVKEKRKKKSGEYTDSGNKNPVHHTSTMKITSLLIFNARYRCTVRLLLLLLHCVGYSHGMPHVLRFGELLLFFPLM